MPQLRRRLHDLLLHARTDKFVPTLHSVSGMVEARCMSFKAGCEFLFKGIGAWILLYMAGCALPGRALNDQVGNSAQPGLVLLVEAVE